MYFLQKKDNCENDSRYLEQFRFYWNDFLRSYTAVLEVNDKKVLKLHSKFDYSCL